MSIATEKILTAVTALAQRAQADGRAPVCIAVADAEGVLQLLHRSDGAPARTAALAAAKAYTAVRMAMPTSAFHRRLLDEKLSLHDFMDTGYTSLAGGVPVRMHEVIVAGVGVSGRTPAQDEELALAFDALLP